MSDYKQLRYFDLHQIVEAVVDCSPASALTENASFQALLMEFNWLADELGYENIEQMMLRLTQDSTHEKMVYQCLKCGSEIQDKGLGWVRCPECGKTWMKDELFRAAGKKEHE